jgi:molecular chaperone Hsp33
MPDEKTPDEQMPDQQMPDQQMPDQQVPGQQVPDQIARCLLGESSVRVVAVTTTQTAREAARRHGAVGVAAVALARGTTAGLLLATLTKGGERVTLQILGDGPLGSLTVDASSEGSVRSFVRHPSNSLPARPGTRISLGRALGLSGVVSVVRDLGMKESFRGQTELVDGEVDTDVEQYLVKSEQIDSVVACDAVLAEDLDIATSGGLLLQALPGSEGSHLLTALRRAARANAVTRVLSDATGPVTAEGLARAVLQEAGADLQVLDSRPVRYFCPCSRERAAATLAMLGPKDLASLVEDSGAATVTCEFCRQRYGFTPDQIGEITALHGSSPV